MERLKDLEAEVINSQRAAELLYAHLTDINSILEHLRKSSEKLEMDHQPASPYSSLIRSVNLKLGKVNVNLDGQDIELDFRKSIFENAKTYYERVKTAKAKIKGLKQALKEIEIKLKELEQTLTSGAESNQHPRFSKEKPWYEKFRWAKTDDDYLIIGGRDAISNELIIKKYTEPQDLVFHADVPGAPFVILKTMGKQASEESILLAAQMAASYSSAWKARSYSLDVFWVKAEQVSKRAPSGEFLMPGSFIIEGKKNYIRNVPLRVSIGIVCKDDELQIIGGPPGTVRNKTKIAIDIVPGHLRSGELAKELFRALTSQSGELRSRILKLPLVELQRFIPPGGGDIARK
jgi:predicted ribosome quality control (RQC) complex YloA/Tae2 family protein